MISRKFIYYLIVNMVMVDIFLIVYMFWMIVLVYVGYEWQIDNLLGEIFCKILILFNYVCMIVLIFIVVVISFDWFLVVIFLL